MAVALDPSLVSAQDLLARTLATRAPADGGDPDRALKAAQTACALTSYSDPASLDTLAIAYASTGRFPMAVATEQKALQLARQRGSSPDLAKTLETHLNLFRTNRRYVAP